MSGFPWQDKDLELSVNKRPIGAFIAFGLRGRLCDNLFPPGRARALFAIPARSVFHV